MYEKTEYPIWVLFFSTQESVEVKFWLTKYVVNCLLLIIFNQLAMYPKVYLVQNV